MITIVIGGGSETLSTYAGTVDLALRSHWIGLFSTQVHALTGS